MVELVNALLNVSRIDLGSFIIDLSLTDLPALADDVIKELRPQAKERVINVTAKYGGDIPKIPADQKLLRIIFQNLLSNAIKYTPPKGKVMLEITRGSPEILITVADSGFGIPKHQQNKIFSKLFRADNVREKEPNGTGLGLYIVKSVVEKSGGRIWFESEENKGTKFFVAFPLRGMEKKEGAKTLI